MTVPQNCFICRINVHPIKILKHFLTIYLHYIKYISAGQQFQILIVIKYLADGKKKNVEMNVKKNGKNNL